jgi:predicted SnoaL-like aldol condensation-catalyzing enzyme
MRRFEKNRMAWLALTLPLLAAAPVFAQGYLSPLEANKKVVFDFYRLVVEPRNLDLAAQFVAADFIEHDPQEQKGMESLIKTLQAMGPPPSEDIGSTLRNPPAFIMAEGDLVTYIFKDKSKTDEAFSLEVYRIKDRKIVEHWKGLAKLP